MARVTVEDCTEVVPSRFELVVLAGQRAKEIASGARITVERDNDKNPVIALREIAEKKLVLEDMRESLVKKLQKRHSIEDQNTQLDDDQMIRADVAEEMKMFSDVISEDEFDGEVDFDNEDEDEK